MTWLGRIAGFSEFKNSGSLEGKITRPRRLLSYWRIFKGRQQISGLKSRIPVQNPAQGKFVSHKALKLLISGLKSGSRKIKRLPKRTCYHDARFKHGYPALLAYLIGRLGASCSNICVFSKESITLLPSWPNMSLGGFLFKHRCIHQREHSVTTLLTGLSCSNIGVFTKEDVTCYLLSIALVFPWRGKGDAVK